MMKWPKIFKIFIGISRQEVTGTVEEHREARQERQVDVKEIRHKESEKRARGARLLLGLDVKHMSEGEFIRLFNNKDNGREER